MRISMNPRKHSVEHSAVTELHSLQELECALTRARATRDKDKIRHALGKLKHARKKSRWF
jgi:hypothetical protein